MTKRIITQEELKEQLHYNPETGIFTRKITSSSRALAGSVTGYKNRLGYIEITVKSSAYLGHRLAWLYMTGNFPKEFIDHIDGVRNNNKFSNLREATHSQNLQNVGMPKNNKSGVKGVTWNKAMKKWRCQCMANRIGYHLGYFDSLESAKNAYNNFAKEKHGEFFGL